MNAHQQFGRKELLVTTVGGSGIEFSGRAEIVLQERALPEAVFYYQGKYWFTVQFDILRQDRGLGDIFMLEIGGTKKELVLTLLGASYRSPRAYKPADAAPAIAFVA